MRRALTLCAVLALSSAILLADDRVVLFDEDVDFSTFKTFMIGSGRMKSDRPELNFPAVLTSIAETIRAGLRNKSLKEVSDNPSLMVDFSVNGVDFVIGPAGRPNPVGQGQRGGRGRAGSATVDFTEATLVIDLKDARSNTLIWRGVYHDTENEAQRLAEALPKDAAALVGEYPPKEEDPMTRLMSVFVLMAAMYIPGGAPKPAVIAHPPDEMSISVDPNANFAVFKTFAFRDRKIESDRPELDNRLFVKKLESAVRSSLLAKGLTEAGSGADLFVDLTLAGEDVNTTAPPPMRGMGPQPVRFTAGTLVIDMRKPGEPNPVWRGVYRDDEKTGSKLVQKLPDDARKLIEKYPKLR